MLGFMDVRLTIAGCHQSASELFTPDRAMVRHWLDASVARVGGLRRGGDRGLRADALLPCAFAPGLCQAAIVD
jgi:hypothetical protein